MSQTEFFDSMNKLTSSSIQSLILKYPHLIKAIPSFLANQQIPDNIRLSCAICYNYYILHQIASKSQDSIILTQQVCSLMTNNQIQTSYKWMMVKTISGLVGQTCYFMHSVIQQANFKYWIDFVKRNLENEGMKMNGLIVLSAIIDSKIEESSLIFFLTELLPLAIVQFAKNVFSITLHQLKALGDILYQSLEMLKPKQQDLQPVSQQSKSHQAFMKIIQLPELYFVLAHVYFKQKSPLIIHLDNNYQKQNIIKSKFTQCYIIVIKNYYKQKVWIEAFEVSIVNLINNFVYSLQQANQYNILRKYNCEEFLMNIVKALIEMLEKSMKNRRLVDLNSFVYNVLIQFLRTDEDKLREMEEEPVAYFEEETDLCQDNKSNTFRGACARLLGDCFDTDNQDDNFVDYCLESILSENTNREDLTSLNSKQQPSLKLNVADSLLVLTIFFSNFQLQQKEDMSAKIHQLFNNMTYFKQLSYFQQGRWLNLLTTAAPVLEMKTLREYAYIVSKQTPLVYFNMRALEFIANCAEQIVFKQSLIEQQQEQEEQMQQNELRANNDCLDQIIDNIVAYIPTTNLQIFWPALRQIVQILEFMMSNLDINTIIHALYKRIYKEIENNSNGNHCVTSILNELHHIAQLSKSRESISINILAIFNGQDQKKLLPFQEELVGIFNVFIMDAKHNINNFLVYLPYLQTSFDSRGFIFQQLFASMNYILKHYTTTVFDNNLQNIYRIIYKSFTLESKKWFEQDFGDSLLLLQVFVHKYRFILPEIIFQQMFKHVSFAQQKSKMKDTQHRIINTYLMLNRPNKQLLIHIQGEISVYNEYNEKVLLIGLGMVFNNFKGFDARLDILILMITLLQKMTEKKVASLMQQMDELKDKNKEQQDKMISDCYYSRNIDFMNREWMGEFKPMLYFKDVLAVNPQTEINTLVESLGEEMSERFREFNPLVGNRKIFKVKKVKENPDIFDLKDIQEELRRIKKMGEREEEKEEESYKRVKME